MSTKIYATVDTLGNRAGFTLTGGQASDLVDADELRPEAAALVIADKTYDVEARVLAPLLKAGARGSSRSSATARGSATTMGLSRPSTRRDT